MRLPSTLSITIASGGQRTHLSPNGAADYFGGPETLLRWLETHLGLTMPQMPHARRVSEFADALEAAQEPAFEPSLRADRWATATELLARRDELLLAGWDETDSVAFPDLVRALARVGRGRTFEFPGVPERLERVLAALNAGQVLPIHCCLLHDSKEKWPLFWQRVLEKLTITDPPPTAAIGPGSSALRVSQTAMLGVDPGMINPDESFRHVRTRSQSSAVEFIAAALARTLDKLPKTVICCADDSLALRLDACLHRLGLPTMGATVWSKAHPVLQILPLSLQLAWDPADPQAILDLLTLPVSPIPRHAATELAKALADEPGVDSRKWRAACLNLESAGADTDRLREQLDAWFGCDRASRGGEIPAQLVRDRCTLVARWAAGRAASLGGESVELIAALRIAADQAALLGELAEVHGASLSEPQLERLLEEALAKGVEMRPFLQTTDGPIRVRSLAEIDGPCERLIWLGVGMGDATRGRWSADQLRRLREAGVMMDDGIQRLGSLQAAEIRGFSQIRESVLIVTVPQDLEQRWHPLWLALQARMPKEEREHPLVLEDLIAKGDTAAIEPFGFACEDAEIVPPQKARAIWEIPSALLKERDEVSASELQDRLSCPLKWTLRYQARLYPSPTARLPDDQQLKGTFCHSVLEWALKDTEFLPTVEEAVERVLAMFDERLPLDAAPMAQPGKHAERRRLRGQLEKATRVLIEALAGGGYRFVGLEVPLGGQVFGKQLKGRIDCVVRRENGEEAILDFKYGGRSKYHALIKDGKAVQLATYAYGRVRPDGSFPRVAYLVLSDGLFYTPLESPVETGGNQPPVEGRSIQAVWQDFEKALAQSGNWLTSDAGVPARPLQDPAEWPEGASIVLDDHPKKGEGQAVCRYCDYQSICGVKETT
jgi:ATP-dependent helicase/nuclease subunit B